jgi:hypothetical protein
MAAYFHLRAVEEDLARVRENPMRTTSGGDLDDSHNDARSGKFIERLPILRQCESWSLQCPPDSTPICSICRYYRRLVGFDRVRAVVEETGLSGPTSGNRSSRTAFNGDLWTLMRPLYSINPSSRNRFMKKLTRERVVGSGP